jgi:aspartate racemase
MKTLGIIGGIAPESTIDYYRQTIERYRERTGTSGYPSIMINSIDLKRLLELVVVGHLDELTNYLAAELGRLIAAGADFGLLAANTPHIVFEQVRARCSIPLLSIVEAACGAARSMGCRRVGLLGTRFTMEAGFYPEVFAAQGIEVILPQADEREFVRSRYVGELVYGVYRQETRHGVLEILERMRERDRVDAAILGGTELPFLFRDGPTPAVPLLDTTRIHVERAVEYLLSEG